MSQAERFCSLYDLQRLCGLGRTDLYAKLREARLINGQRPSVRAIQEGCCKRQWREQYQEYRWIWHRDKTLQILKSVGVQTRNAAPKKSPGLFESLAGIFGLSAPAASTATYQPDRLSLVPSKQAVDSEIDTVLEHADEEEPQPAAADVFGVLAPADGGKPIRLRNKRLLAGRDPSCHLVIHHSSVSSYHCELRLENGHWYVKDLNSTNGVYVDGSRIADNQKHRVNPGSVLSIGPQAFKLQYSSAALRRTAPAAGKTQILRSDVLKPVAVG